MTRYLLCIFLFLVSFFTARSQQHRSVHQEHLQEYKQNPAKWDSLHPPQTTLQYEAGGNCNLEKVVFGWHPYWISDATAFNYKWNLLSDLSYFSYEVNPNDGSAYSTHNWATSPVIDTAQAHGVNVNLCVTLFSNHSTFFSSSAAQQNLIDNLITMVQNRNANGVNIDFEGVPGSEATNFTNFMIDLSNQMHNQVPGSQVSMALPSVDWNNVFDMATLDQYVDLSIIMGYGYYYSGSSTAGPTDPLYNFAGGSLNLSRSVNYYLNEGTSPSKLALGLPYYGYEWETSSSSIPSSTTSSGTSRTFQYVQNNTSGYYTSTNEGWDQDSQSRYFVFNDGANWNQCFINTAYSLGRRCDLINRRGIAGMGIWALGYDAGYTEYWDVIEDKFTDCGVTACQDTIYDMGGPGNDYYNDENYTYTIQPTSAASVSLDFLSFQVETGYDTLWIYDGTDTNAPLIGNYTGSNSPGQVNASGNAITLHWESDGATVGPGWEIAYNCSYDTIPPVTVVDTINDWQTGDFTASFTDTDQGSGVAKSFYQVIDKNGNGDWRANFGNGFFSDNFDQAALHSDWSIDTGNWQLNSGVLEQTDESISNTNIYAGLDQDLSNRYLYHWKGKMTGTGTNRRAGLHFFCDQPGLSNRGNSYFVYFRLDDDKIQIYEVNSNSWGSGPVTDIPYDFQDNQWYDYKVTYDRITGAMRVYIDDELEAEWKDGSPHANGDFVSFRSGNCNYQVNNFKVYRSRYPSATITVGPDSTDDVRYQSPNPTSFVAKVKSIIQDSTDNLSEVDFQEFKVDWTAPGLVAVNDGLGSDIDTTYDNTELSANWTTSQDTNSGIQAYQYAIGTSPGATDVVGWTGNGANVIVTHTGLSLTYGQDYFFQVMAENGAGLTASPSSSNGQVVVLATSQKEPVTLGDYMVYPNPFQGQLRIEWDQQTNKELQVTMRNIAGKVVPIQVEQNGNSLLLQPKDGALAKGIYTLFLDNGSQTQSLKVIHE